MQSRKIDNETAKIIMVNMLSAFDDYCSEHNLTYFLAYGTLLGAIRHNGFIPWDNDIDVWMPRPDYDLLRELTEKQSIAEDLYILDWRKERTFPFAKLINNKTILREHFLVTENNLGLYIDIFPLDGLPNDDETIHDLQAKSCRLNRIYSFANYRFGTGKNIHMKLLKLVLFPISRIVSSKKICQKLDELCKEFNFDKSIYVGSLTWGYGFKEKINKGCFEPIKWEFENKEYYIPKGYDEILRNYYGDYLTLPPEEKRIIHYYDASWKE